MRIFLIIFSFINAFFYFVLYANYENIIAMFTGINLSTGALSFLKTIILLVFGFLIGLIISFLSRPGSASSFFDYRTAIIAGIFPFLFLILSQGAIMSFITVNIFGANRQISEFVFYFLSRQAIWTMWLGIALGVSVRIAFKKKLKHAAGIQ